MIAAIFFASRRYGETRIVAPTEFLRILSR